MFQRSGRSLAMIDDAFANLGGEGWVVQDRLVCPKYRSLFRADLAGDFLVQGAQIRSRPFSGQLESS
jgi:hypothetical protein